MRKSKMLVVILAMLMLTAWKGTTVQAAPSLSVSGNTSVKEGDTVSITATVSMGDIQATGTNITFDSSVLQYVSCSDSQINAANGYVRSTTLWGGASSATIKYTFKAIKTGSSTVSVFCDVSNSETEFQVGKNITVKVSAPVNTPTTPTTPTEPSKSSEARLSSMVVSPGTLSPEFNKSTYDYKVQVDKGVSEIAITAKTVDSTAKVSSVNGASDLKVGANTVTIVTKAEAGNTKTYTIAVQVGPYPDEVVIEANVDGTKYQVAMDLGDIDIPSGSEQSTVEIEGNSVPSISYNQGMLFLVKLVDDEGNGELYSYEKGTSNYTLFQEAVSKANSYVIKNLGKDYKVPVGYELVTISIGDYHEVQALIKTEGEASIESKDVSNSKTGDVSQDVEEDQGQEDLAEKVTDEVEETSPRFYYIKAENMSREEGWYRYDSLEGTLQACEEPTEEVTEASKTAKEDTVESTMADMIPIDSTKVIILLSILSAGLAIALVVSIVVQPKNRTKKEENDLEEKE